VEQNGADIYPIGKEMTIKSKTKNEKEDFPRKGSALYNLINQNEIIKQKTLKRWKRLNKYLVLPLYRLRILPLLGFGRIFLILTTIGRLSGKKRKTPLEYHRIDDIITIFSGRGEEAGWVKNIRANPGSVWVRHGFHSFQATAVILTNENEKLKIIKWYVVKHSRSAKMIFGWNSKIDDPETTDFSKLLEMLTIIRIYKKND